MVDPVSEERLRQALAEDPALTLLKAYSRDWVIPLFLELERVGESVSAEWFHERVEDVLSRNPEWSSSLSASQHCNKWVTDRWLETESVDGRTRYRLSPHSLRVLSFLRELLTDSSSVSGARLGSIANAVRILADITDPSREAQVARLDQRIAELQRQRDEVASGRVRLASVEEMRHQLVEVLGMTRSLPADFRQLRSLIDERHQQVARRAMTDAPTKAELVEDYLHENDLLDQTDAGRAYRGFMMMLGSREATAIRSDIEQILSQDFAREHMTPAEREQIETLLSDLLAAEMTVSDAYVRWTGSLRRFLTRGAQGQHQRLIRLADQALQAGAQWAAQDLSRRYLDAGDSDLLGVGSLDVMDVSQTQLWRDNGDGQVQVHIESGTQTLPEEDRQALRLAAGTSIGAVRSTINRLITEQPVVTGAEVHAAIPREFQRLGAIVSLLDLAIRHGEIDPNMGTDQLPLSVPDGPPLVVTLPRVTFRNPIPEAL